MPKQPHPSDRKAGAGRRPAATERGEVTRARLLEAAAEQFRTRGYHGTSMRQIASAAGVAVGGIYNHFDGKEDIFAAVLDAYHPYHVILPALAETTGDSLEALLLQAARRVEAAMQGAEDKLMPLVLIELLEFRGQHLSALAQRMLPDLMMFVQRLQARTNQMRAVPLPVMVRSLAALFIGYYMSQLILRNVPVFAQLDYDWFGGMMEVFLHGVIAAGDEGAHAAGRPA